MGDKMSYRVQFEDSSGTLRTTDPFTNRPSAKLFASMMPHRCKIISDGKPSCPSVGDFVTYKGRRAEIIRDRFKGMIDIKIVEEVIDDPDLPFLTERAEVHRCLYRDEVVCD